MNILVTGANGQLGNEMRILAKESQDKYIFTDVNQVEGVEPDIVMACCGDVPTLEALAATSILRENFPEIKIRFVNIMQMRTLAGLKNKKRKRRRIFKE